MAKRREVVWTKNSEIQLQEILEFFTLRNKSNQYSQKLYKQFKMNSEYAAPAFFNQLSGYFSLDY